MWMLEKEAQFMAIRYKVDVLAELKKKGYSSTKIREEKLIGQSYLQQLRHQELVSWKTMDTICGLLDCQVGDLVEYVKDAAGGVQ
jgi:putative transcriptional regulator